MTRIGGSLMPAPETTPAILPPPVFAAAAGTRSGMPHRLSAAAGGTTMDMSRRGGA